jgi:hypothetical protein
MDYSDDRPPTFRETTAFIRATHKIVEDLEASQFQSIDPERYIEDLIWEKLAEGSQAEARSVHRKRRITAIWGRDFTGRTAAVGTLLLNAGLSKEKAYPYALEFDNSILESLCKLNPTEVMARLSGRAMQHDV